MHAPVLIDSGTQVGPYVVERRLAQGGLSVLYVARDPEGNRLVLKMVLPEAATSATRARLLREARALALVDHPGIVRVHGTGEHGGMPWIAMDLVVGTDMKRVIAERGPLLEGAALRYVIQAAQALVAAHDAGVVHRDLKPSNILLTPEGRVVLVDFGIAKRRADAREGDVLTSAREVLGTPAYLAPEQLDHGLADERSDIWALGCVLYEMVVGEPPFGRGGSATSAAILRDEPVFPPELSSDVVQIVSACLRKNSFARIASPRELLGLLRDALPELSDETRPRSELRPDVATRSDRPPPSSRRTSTRPSALPIATPTVHASSRPPPASIRANTSRPASRPAALTSAATLPRIPVAPPYSSPARPPVASSSLPPPPSSSLIRTPASRGHVKGTALRAAVSWFSAIYGQDALVYATSLGSPGLRAMLRTGDPSFVVMSSGWYETQLVGEFLDALEQVAAPADPIDFGSRLAAAIAEDNVHGVYRALFRLVASPALLEANAQRVWQTYFDEGAMTVLVRAPGHFEATVRGWGHHHPSMCRTVAMVIEHALRKLGYGALTVERAQCVARGAGRCAYDGRWVVQ